MTGSRWRHALLVSLLWGGIYVTTQGDSCDGAAQPPTVVATASPGTPIDQLSGVVVIISLVSEAGQPVVGAETTLSWSPDTNRLAGTTSKGISDDRGRITFQGFGDSDFGTWNLTVAGNYTQTVPRFRKSGNPNPYTYVVKVLPSPSPSPSESPTPSPSESPTPSPSATPTPTPTPTVSATAPASGTPNFGAGGGGGGSVTAPAGAGPVSTRVVITAGSPQAAEPQAVLP